MQIAIYEQNNLHTRRRSRA